VKDTVVSYTSKSEVEKVLVEATSNENWNLSNSKLQLLADATYE
jgi:archaellum component FlaF (FlaF/FlaG flagellin family)